MKTMNNFIMSAVAGLILINTEAKADLLQCKPCPAGYICDGKKKEACPAGTYQTYKTSTKNPKDSYCSQCNLHKYSSEGASECTACPKYHFAEDNKTCKLCPRYSSDKDFGFFFIAQCSVGKSYESGDKLYWTLNFYHPNNTAKYKLKFYNMDVYDSHELSDIVKNACKSGDYIYTLSPLQSVTKNSVYDVEYLTNMKDTGQKVLSLLSMDYQNVRFPSGSTGYNNVAPCSLEIKGSYNSYTHSTFKYLWDRQTAWISLFASYPTLQDFKNLPQDLPYFPQYNSSYARCVRSAMFKSNYKTPDNYVKNRDSIGCNSTLASSNLTSSYLDGNDEDHYIKNYDYYEDDDD